MHETPSDLFIDDVVKMAKPRGSGFETGRSISESSNQQLSADASQPMNGDDPLSRRGVKQEENIAGFVPGRPMTMDGRVDPVYGRSGLSIGDRIYHKKQHVEGTVTAMMASGKIVVTLDNGKKGTTEAENLAKL